MGDPFQNSYPGPQNYYNSGQMPQQQQQWQHSQQQGSGHPLGCDLSNPSQPMPLMGMRIDNPGDQQQNNMGNPEGEKKPEILVLPKVLEEVLALKDRRAAQFDANADNLNAGGPGHDGDDYGGQGSGEDSDVEDGDTQVNGLSSGSKKNTRQSKAEKNKKKKLRKKMNRKLKQQKAQEQQQEEHSVGDAQHEGLNGEEKEEEKSKEREEATPIVNEEEVNGEEAVEKDKKEEEVDEKERKSRSKDKDKEKSRRHRDKDKDKRKSKKSDEKENEKRDEENLEDVTIEYVPERITIADLAPMYRQFYRVFEIFKLENKPKPSEKDKAAELEAAKDAAGKKAAEKAQEEDEFDQEDEFKDDKEKLSKRKLKKLTRLSVAELKQLVSRPDVVEMHDVTARDPKLLVQLKAYRNTVPVPRHWCFKRKYLQGKRGIEKPPFDLPAFIKKTGIMEMRESLQEKDDAKSLKTKMRERIRPKMGKIDIDYQKLHDAFFKWQTKPRMTIHGDLYYEGKEFETRLKEKKPGDLSEELRIALGMPVGPNSHKIPPPWLIAQQRYGPPPSYPNLKIPGLNAPIPEGCSFGYHAGGWGKPPVDESGKPLYGDVFGTNLSDMDNAIDEGDIERAQWGELESESEDSSEEEEDEGEDMANPIDDSGLVTPAEGLITPSGLSSIPAGLETPETIELRKKKIEAEMEDNETPVLYQVLPEKRNDRLGAAMMASTHVYDITGVSKPAARQTGDREGMVELALDPSELDMDNEAMAQRYEQQMREQATHLQKEDLSDMLAEHVARQKSKRKRQQADTSKTTKKYKEFKF